MRDPNRIDRIITELRELWHHYPDQRLGQLVTNYADNNRGDTLFFIEDDKAENNLLIELAKVRSTIGSAYEHVARASLADANKDKSFQEGDIVEWEVWGSGGPGYIMGHIQCEVLVNPSKHEMSVKPLDWGDAWEVLEPEYDFKDFLDDYKRGFLDCVGTDHCKIIKRNKIEAQVDNEEININLKDRKEAKTLLKILRYPYKHGLLTVDEGNQMYQLSSQLERALES